LTVKEPDYGEKESRGTRSRNHNKLCFWGVIKQDGNLRDYMSRL